MFNFKKIKFLKIFSLLIFFILFIIFTFKFTYSKFTHSDTVSGATNIANFAFSINYKNGEIVKDSLKENEEIVYEFSVQNFSENTKNEVKSKYDILLEPSHNNPPLIIELYRVRNGVEEKLELENFKTKTSEIFNIGDLEANYRVKVRYNENSGNQDLLENFNIKMKIVNIQEEE